MQTPEEVAREASCEVSWNAAEDWTCHSHETAWQDEDAWCPVAADVIRSHVAEMAELIESLTIENAGLKGDVRDVLNSLDISAGMSPETLDRNVLNYLQFQVGTLLGRWRETGEE